MRRYISVLRLFARSTFLPLLLILAAMAAGEWVLFQTEWQSGGAITFEETVEQSRMFWAFGAGFLAMTVLLCLPGCEFGSKTGYTLRRLSVSEKTVFWLQSSYNFLCYLLLWGVQLAVVLLCWNTYIEVNPSAVGGQTLFLAFYRSKQLLPLLPMDFVSLWIRNFVLIFGVSLTTAQFSFTQRRGGKFMLVVPMVILAVLMYSREINRMARDITAMMFTVSFAAFAFGRVYKKEDDDEG